MGMKSTETRSAEETLRQQRLTVARASYRKQLCMEWVKLHAPTTFEVIEQMVEREYPGGMAKSRSRATADRIALSGIEEPKREEKE
jgi:hypothetical protein